MYKLLNDDIKNEIRTNEEFSEMCKALDVMKDINVIHKMKRQH